MLIVHFYTSVFDRLVLFMSLGKCEEVGVGLRLAHGDEWFLEGWSQDAKLVFQRGSNECMDLEK